MTLSSVSSLLPGKLPPEIQKALSDPGTVKLVRFYPEGEDAVYAFPSLCSPDGERLLLSLPAEHTEAGCLLVESLWQDLPAEVLLFSGRDLFATSARVFRCHIAGPVFRQLLDKARALSPEADIASVFELHPSAWARLPEEASDIRPEDAKLPESGPFPELELHLDHPRFRVAGEKES